jgi:hypothetical protein
MRELKIKIDVVGQNGDLLLPQKTQKILVVKTVAGKSATPATEDTGKY